MPDAPTKSNRTRVLLIALATLALLAGGAFALLRGGYAGGQMHGLMHGMMHGEGGMRHDETTMPGLRGDNVSPEESEDMAVLFRNFETITRDVTNLPDGIRTVTNASNPHVMDSLVRHVTIMIDRVATLDDPQVFIQSPTLDLFFARGDGITSTIDITDDGIVVVQTSDDLEMVAALQTHAAEVTDMADRGMQAVHDAMAARAAN